MKNNVYDNLFHGFQTHSLKLNPVYFDLIKSGEKTLEGRLNDEKRKNINIGDEIIFYKEPERVEMVKAIILNKFVFKNFEEMASKMDRSKLGFADKTKDEMIAVYRSIYKSEDEKKYGVVIFEIKII